MARYPKVLSLALVLFITLSCGLAYAARKDNLILSKMGKNTKTGFGDIDLEQKFNFNASDEEILWFCKFKLLTASAQAGLRAEWITPAGEVFKKQDFKPFYWNISYAWAKLDIQGEDKAALGLEGEWTVKIYWDNELIDEQRFSIGNRMFKQATTPVAIKEDPGTYAGHMELAQVFFAQGKMEMTIDHLRKAKTLEPKKPQSCVLLGLVYNTLNQPDKAILQFAEAENLGGDEFQISRGRGFAYSKLGITDKAKQCFERALSLRPDDESLKQALSNLDQKQK